MLWILDTDHTSLFQRGNPTVTRNIQSKPRLELAITIVSYEEQIRGWFKVVSRSLLESPCLRQNNLCLLSAWSRPDVEHSHRHWMLLDF